MPPGKDEERGWRLLRKYGNLGTELAAAVLIGAWGGRAIDGWLGTAPWFLIIGFVLGVAAGFMNIYRLVASEDSARKKKGKKG